MKLPIDIPIGKVFDVFGFGSNTIDVLIGVPAFPEVGSKVEFSGLVRAAGGEVATTMAGLQRLGLSTAYAGRFGNDDAGSYGLSALLDEGIDVSYCQTIEGADTQTSYIVIDERTGERTVFWHRDKRLAFSIDEAPTEALRNSRVLHMTPHDTAVCLRLAQEAQLEGIPVSLDIDAVFESIEELLPLVDILITSSGFPELYLGIDDPKRALSEMQERFGNTLVGITFGAQGSLLLCCGEFIETAGYNVPGGCKDTTGAGDAFRSGLLYGLLKGESVETSAEMANAVAALKCRSVGARTALPNESELKAIMRKS